MKQLAIGFALAIGLTATSVSAQHRHHGYHYHVPRYHVPPPQVNWVLPALLTGTVVYLATKPQQTIVANQVVVIDGINYTRQIMLVNGVETEVLVKQ